MQINVRNYRGIDRATIEPNPIALVAGSNGVGKTSILEGAAGALAGEPIPIYAGEKPALKKKDAGDLVGPYGKRGKAVATGEDGSAQVNWPGAKASSEGQPPHASALATGLIDFPALPEKRRAAILGELIDAEPTFQDLASAITDELGHEAGDGAQIAQPVWATIQEQGWEATHKAYKDELSRKKGQWEEVTGERYGGDKAEGWEPEGWTSDLEDLAISDLEIQLANARDREKQARAAQAMDEQRRQTLQEKADDLEPAQEAKKAAENEYQQETARLQQLRSEYSQMAAQPDAYCPDCGVPLAIGGSGQSYDLTTMDLSETADQETLNAKADGIETVKKRVQDAQASLDGAKHRIQDAGNAKAELEAIPETGQAGDDPEAAAEEVQRLRNQQNAKKAMDRARELHSEILVDQAIVTALAPEGVRRQALVKALDAFNKQTLAIASQGWAETVWLDEDFTPHYGQRPFYLCSLSEAYRVRVSMRIALAHLDGSQTVILDGADVLDSAGRNHLIQLLVAAQRDLDPESYMVGITLNRKDQAPDLAAHNLGQSYWVADGKAEAL